jgi:hypothetical protein
MRNTFPLQLVAGNSYRPLGKLPIAVNQESGNNLIVICSVPTRCLSLPYQRLLWVSM